MSEPTVADLESAISALLAQRAALGDAVVDTAVRPMQEKLAALRAAIPQRRLVTVLFLDIVGSTALSQSLDPEEIQDIMDGALQHFSSIVDAHRGKVLQYAGDSLLAAFGTNVASEDDAERALLTGLALLAEAQRHAERVQQQYGQAGFAVRVGCHTGTVLLGGGVDAEGTIRGFTVNIAARMEQAAPPGTLRISHDTFRHVSGVFDVEPQPPLLVKGQDEPLRTYLVVRAKPRAFRLPTRGIEGVETPLLGRSTELNALVTALDATRHDRALQAVTIIAEPGLGKSRPLHEVQHHLETNAQPWWLLLGRAQPSGALQPYGLLREVLAWRLQISASDSAQAARTRLIDGLAPLLGDQGDVHAALLGQLIGMDFSTQLGSHGALRDPRQLRDRALDTFKTYLKQLAASDGSPLLMLLDDLQWADDASLDWLQSLQQDSTLPLTLVMAARPELLERRPDWGQALTAHRRIDLAPLNVTQRRDMTGALLQRLGDGAAHLHELVERQSEGNPFYAEELVKMLIDEGVIDSQCEPWQLHAERLDPARVPTTLTGVLQARLGALDASERRALQLASIVGPVFWDDALASLDANAPQDLTALQRKSMVHARAESTFQDTREESFQHHLLHQVTYDTVLRAERRAGHAAAAQWLAARVGDREAEYLAVTAEHYDRAGDKSRAIDWYERAAVAARARFANASAREYLQRVLAMPELTDARRRYPLLISQSGLADLLGDRSLQHAALTQAAALADHLDDDALRAEALANQALLADRLAKHDDAVALASRAAECADRSGAAAPGALAYGELAFRACADGQLDAAATYFDSALRWARTAAAINPDHVRYEIMMLINISILHERRFDLEQRLQSLQSALQLSQGDQHRRLRCSCHEFLGLVWLDLCDASAAAQHLEQLAMLVSEIGFVTLEASVLQQRSMLAWQHGQFAEAAEHAAAAAAACARTGAGDRQAMALFHQANAELGRGRTDAARALLQQALAITVDLTLTEDARACRLLIADTWRASGEVDRALAEVDADMPELDRIGAFDGTYSPLSIRMAAWRVLDAAQDLRAPRHLALAHAELQLRTEHIGDPAVRARVLAAPLHREIISAWDAGKS